MALQILLGSIVMVATLAVGAAALYLLELASARGRSWLVVEPHWPKIFVVLIGSGLWAMLVLTIGVWLWALSFWALGAFPDLETAVYFSVVCFTTLGFGDVLLPTEWRIMGGMTAANGLLNFGILSAILVEGLRDLRVEQGRRSRG